MINTGKCQELNSWQTIKRALSPFNSFFGFQSAPSRAFYIIRYSSTISAQPPGYCQQGVGQFPVRGCPIIV